MKWSPNPIVVAGIALLGLGGFAFSQRVIPSGPPNGIACAYNTSPPTVTNGQAVWVQCDSSGKLITSSGSSGGGSAVTIADGADVAEGTTTDAACATDNGTCTVNAVAKRIAQRLTTVNTTLGTPFQAGGALAANQSVNVAQVGGTNTVSGGIAGSLAIGGTVATNVAITANPLNLGAQAVSSENSAATTARQVQLVADLVGKLIVLPYANPENFVSGVITSAMTGTTSTSLVASPGGSLRNYLTACTFSNGQSDSTKGTDIVIQDGNGGTTIWIVPAAAVYGGAHITFPTPLRQPTTATAIYVANVTTGASTKAACSGYKGL